MEAQEKSSLYGGREDRQGGGKLLIPKTDGPEEDKEGLVPTVLTVTGALVA